MSSPGGCRSWSISKSSGNASSTPAWVSPSASALSFFFIQQIYDFLTAPAIATLPPGSKLIYTQPTEAFSLYINISLISGVVFAAPFIMYQVWKFIAPGLYSNEKKFVIPFVLFSTLGFLGGSGVQSLRRVPVHHDLLRQLQHAEPVVHAAAE